MATDPTDLAAMKASRAERSQRIRELNDAFRSNPTNRELGRFVMSASVAALPPAMVACALAALMTFDEFTEGNDPHGEHDFGSFDISIEGDKTRFLWKVDYYNSDLSAGSEDPADPEVTTRVLTLMLPSDY